MYDWPEIASDWDEFWVLVEQALVQREIIAPRALSRSNDPFELWRDENLLLGQTCGWPYANLLADQVVPVANFDHGLQHAPAGHYYSVFICKLGETRTPQAILQSDSIVAVNGLDSQSGFRVLREIDSSFVDQPPKDRIATSGSHRNSIAMVAKGKADFAAIDAVSFELAKAFDHLNTESVTVLGHSAPRPSLPVITSLANKKLVSQLYGALADAVAAMPEALKQQLHIYDVQSAQASDYAIFREAVR